MLAKGQGIIFRVFMLAFMFLVVAQCFLTEKYDDGRINIYSFDKKRLSASPDKKLSLNYNKGDWEKWRLIPVGNDKFEIQSWHGTYLKSNPNGEIELTDVHVLWEQWKKINLGGFVFFQSTEEKINILLNTETDVKLIFEKE